MTKVRETDSLIGADVPLWKFYAFPFPLAPGIALPFGSAHVFTIFLQPLKSESLRRQALDVALCFRSNVTISIQRPKNKKTIILSIDTVEMEYERIFDENTIKRRHIVREN